MPAISGGVVVVGGCGTVGHLIAPYLELMCNSHALLAWTFEPSDCDDCRWSCRITGDVLGQLLLALRGKKAIIFSAMGRMSDPQSLFEVGVRGWYNCLLAARDLGIQRLVLVSSISVYDDYRNGLESEDRPRVCDDPYGRAVAEANRLYEGRAQAGKTQTQDSPHDRETRRRGLKCCPSSWL